MDGHGGRIYTNSNCFKIVFMKSCNKARAAVNGEFKGRDSV